MVIRYCFVLNMKFKESKVFLGAFSSIGVLKKHLKKMSKHNQYIVHKIPLNTLLSIGKAFDWSKYSCHYFGTFEEEVVRTGDGKKEGRKMEKVTFWPE